MIEVITILSERLENQAVEIAKLKADLEAETARSSRLRKWWDEATERADRLDVQNVETGKENDALKDERQSWEYERAALLNQVKDLKGDECDVLDGPDDVDVERMQGTADHDPESLVGDEAYE